MPSNEDLFGGSNQTPGTGAVSGDQYLSKETQSAAAYNKNKARWDAGQYNLNDRIFDAEDKAREDADRYARSQAGAQNRQASQIDYGQANQDRARQQAVGANQDQLGQYYQNMMAGNGPSVAEQQMMAGLDRSIAAQQSAANSARGGTMAASAAQRNAAFQGAAMSQQTVQQQAALRAGEQQQAADAYGQMLANQRAAELQAQGMSAQQAQAVADNEARQRAQNDAMTQAYLGAETGTRSDLYSGLLQQQGNAIGQQQAAQQAADAARQRSDQRTAGYLSAVATTGAAVLPYIAGTGSDERMKSGVRDVDGEAIDSFLESLEAKRFRYRQGYEEDTPPGERYGVIAQDVEKTPMGKSFVGHDSEGMRYLDGGQGMGAILAALGRVNERLAKVEGGK